MRPCARICGMGLPRAGPGPPRTAVCCPRVHVPMTLGGPRAGEPRGDGPPLPPPQGCYSGRRAQSPGMCAKRGRPAPSFCESGALPPLHRRPDRVPARVPFPGHHPFLGSFPPHLPQGHPSQKPARLGSAPGIPARGPGHPQRGAPSVLGRSSAPGVGRGAPGAPSRRAHSRALLSPEDAPHPASRPPRQPPPPAPRAASSSSGARPESTGSPCCAAVAPPSPTSVSPLGRWGRQGSPPDTSRRTSALRGLANAGSPQGYQHPISCELSPPHSGTQQASCPAPLLSVAHRAPWAAWRGHGAPRG